MVVWAAPDDLWQRGGSALTIADTLRADYDGIVYAQENWHIWSAGNSHGLRAQKNQGSRAKETVGPDDLVQMAITYQGKDITIYRNGKLYAKYDAKGTPYEYTDATLF